MENKHSLVLNYGLREQEVFNELLDMSKSNSNIPDNRTEILRRGLHIFRYLLEVDEYNLLNFLSLYLKHISENMDKSKIHLAADIAFSIYSTMIVKKGVLSSELFETIPMNLKLISKLDSENLLNEITTEINEIKNSIDKIFLATRKFDSGSTIPSFMFIEDKEDTASPMSKISRLFETTTSPELEQIIMRAVPKFISEPPTLISESSTSGTQMSIPGYIPLQATANKRTNK